LAVLFLFLPGQALAERTWVKRGWGQMANQHLELPDGRSITIKLRSRKVMNVQAIILKQGRKLLWRRYFSGDYGALWLYVFFVPIKRNNQYWYDVNGDGDLEVAIVPYDGGRFLHFVTAIIFSVKPNYLEYVTSKKFRLFQGRYVYP